MTRISIGECAYGRTLCINGKAWFHWNPIHHWLYGWEASREQAAGVWVIGYECDWRERCYWSGAKLQYRVHKIIRRAIVQYLNWKIRGLIIRKSVNPTQAIQLLPDSRIIAEAMYSGVVCFRDGRIDVVAHTEHQPGSDACQIVCGSQSV